jgi:dTMP kinase
MFFTFDGIDGTGKSTQANLFCDWLTNQGKTVVHCRDPGSTKLGEQLRDIVLQRGDLAIDARSETLIYMAARAQLVEEIIRPALARGDFVVSDRYLLANVVYQAHGLGLDVDQIWEVGRFATGGLEPARTFLLDMDVAAARRRLQGDADRMEERDMEYFQRVREGFLAEARRQPDRIVIIAADGTENEVQDAIRAASEIS